jgi:peptidoglycan/LPS O-acetylase OafA/YrhL
MDRISRIWVPLVPALLLSLGVALFCGLPASLPDLVGNALGLQGIFFKNFAHNEPLWSLSYEIWFYVLIGAVGVILTQASRSRVVALLILLIGFMVFTRLSPIFLNCWLLGAFSYFLISERKRPALLILALALAFLGAAISQLQSDSLSVSRNALMSLLPARHVATLIESAGIGLLIASICRSQPTTQVMVEVDKLGTTLAAFSYTLYLTHYPILGLWEHFIPERSPVFSPISFAIFVAKICSCLSVKGSAFPAAMVAVKDATVWVNCD